MRYDPATALHPRQQSETLSLKKKMSQPGAVAHDCPALSEAEVGGSQGQEIETILANTLKPNLY